MIRILVADDHAIVREGLKQILVGVEDMHVGGEACTGKEALAKIRESSWDVVLLDISMPDKNGIDTLKQIRQERPDLPVLILSMFPEDQYAVSLLRAGAAGYMTKESAPSQLVNAIRKVAQGKKFISGTLAETLALELGGDIAKPAHESLSEREFQIFCKLAVGQTASQIAEELFISVKTVSTYRSRILQKMKMKTNADLTYYAIKSGLVE
ncbi:MAG: response regulator [Burkholderiales bacterium]|nr:response regulator transcription factor [Burkholderiales bacterium]MDQ3196646.1 response regulator transcription factor [Pseudomonadota bacterium]